MMRPDLNQRVFLLCVLASIERIVQPNILVEESFSIKGAIREILSTFFRGALTDMGRDQFDRLQQS
jgi:hypothetical protein